jgi:hypothetical protein
MEATMEACPRSLKYNRTQIEKFRSAFVVQKKISLFFFENFLFFARLKNDERASSKSTKFEIPC